MNFMVCELHINKLFKKKSIRQARSGKGISGNEMAGAEAEQQE